MQARDRRRQHRPAGAALLPLARPAATARRRNGRNWLRHALAARHGDAAGFSLTEMLIATIAGVLVLGALITLLLAYVRSRERLEAQMRLQDDWGKLQFLLDREIQESTPVTAASSVSAGCSIGGGTLRLSLEVPGNGNRITYYTTATGSQLRRCGPEITSSGNLGSTVSDALVLDGVVSFTVDDSDPQRPSFLLSLRDPSGVTYTNRSQPSGTTFRSRSIN